MFTLLPQISEALLCVCGGCVIIHPQQQQEIFLGLNLTFVFSSVSDTSLPLPSSGTAPREGESLHSLGKTEMRSSFWLQPFPKAVCTVCRYSPWRTAASTEMFPYHWLRSPTILEKVWRIFSLYPSKSHTNTPTFLFPAKVPLQTRRHKPAGMGSRQSSSCCLRELLVPSALLSTELLPSPIAEPAQQVPSSVSVLEVSSLPCSELISWQHLSQREAPGQKYLGLWQCCCWSPLCPWHGDRIVERSLVAPASWECALDREGRELEADR